MAEAKSNPLKELGIEFAVELLLFLLPYGAEQMDLPHNFWLGALCWAAGTAIGIRMFWIFPYGVVRLTRLEKGLIASICVFILMLAVYRPVIAAYRKQRSTGTNTNTQSSANDASGPKTQTPMVAPIPDAKAPIKTPAPRTTKPSRKPEQDNSVHVEDGSRIAQQSSGDCSPNFVDGSNTVTCGSIPKTGINLTASLLDPTGPSIVVHNDTGDVVEDVVWELVMFRTTDQAYFSFPTQTIGYIKPHSQSARYLMELNNLPRATPNPGQIKSGETFIGSLSIDCPTCQGTTLLVGFVWGVSGWFYQLPDGKGRLLLPKDLNKDTVSKFTESIDAAVKTADRTPIL